MTRNSLVLASLIVPSLAAAQPAPAPTADQPPPASTDAAAIAPAAGAPVAAPAAPVDQPPLTAHARPRKKILGVGYKAGNGIGFLGADVIVDPIPHAGVDLQAAFMPVTAANGETGNIYAIAPSVHGYLFGGGRSTPYMAVGMVAASLTLGSASASVLGTFANIGYEWRWRFGLGLQLGAGVGYIQKGEAHDGANMVEFGGKWNPNIELGLRYFLF